ncbi:DUF4872 domain-containing protein [Tumebacillus sp. DT12]|uniref:DUF4872 domain-containing protein n=1 Tax=Tumebacillus lacus TaxID=2995335 RepID=A0ABT3X4G1_9BACL|nr:BtrH N-terminal domain-containing protein [Tumebacillus lacus]MCX7571790.1 DUF4872 domain-containing protein [Tumebacillus lacus]
MVLLEDFQHRLSVTCRAGNIRDVLAYKGHSMSEAMVFGVANSLSFYYVLPDETLERSEYVLISGNSHLGLEDVASNLSLSYETWLPESEEQKWKHVRELLEAGHPVFMDAVLSMYMHHLRATPLFGMGGSAAEREGFVSNWDDMFSRLQIPAGTHLAVVIGLDEEKGEAYIIENNLSGIQTVPIRVLAEASNPKMDVTLHPQGRYSIYNIPQELPALAQTISRAIPMTMQSFLGGDFPWRGIGALDRLARDLRHWPEMLPMEFVENSMHMIYYVSEVASGGGLYRRLYSRYLKEAAAICGDDRLAAVSKEYQVLAKQWRTFTKGLSDGAGRAAETLRSESLNDLIGEIAAQERKAAETLAEWLPGGELAR